MGTFQTFIEGLGLILNIILIVLVIFLIIGQSSINNRVNRIRRRYDRLLRGQTDLNLEELLGSHGQEIEELDNKYKELSAMFSEKENKRENRILTLENSTSQSIQKIAIVKYNAFEYMEGKNSFSLALLDGNNNGLILTSIFGRDSATSFAKEIIKGQALEDLSEEEYLALTRAMDYGLTREL